MEARMSLRYREAATSFLTPGRMAGLCALGALLLPVVASIGFAGDLPIAGQSVQRIRDAIVSHGRLFEQGSLIDQVGQMLFLAFVVIVAMRSKDRALATLAIASIAVGVAINGLAVASTFASVQLAQGGGDPQAVASLFYLTPGVRGMDSSGTIVFGPVFGIMALRGHLLPAVLAWVPIALGIIGLGIEIAIIWFPPAGFAGFLVFIVYLVWLLSTGVYLVARPHRLDVQG
jgi:hypothetical protein